MTTPPVSFRFLSQADMVAAGVGDLVRCVDVMEECFALVGAGDYVMGGSTRNSHGMRVWFPLQPAFPGMPKGGPDQRFMSLPGYLGGRFNVCGNKWYGSNVHNPRQRGLPRSILLMILNDPVSAAPLAIMSANLLSGIRTGAVVGLAARYLSRDDSETLGVVAAGPINRYSTRAIASQRPSLRRINVFDINRDAARRFADEMSARLDITVSVVDSMADAVKGADIVTSAISGSATPLFEERWLAEGSLLAAPGRTAVEDAYILRADVVTDCWAMQKTYHLEGMMMPPGERLIPHARLHQLVAEGQVAESDIIDLGAVVNGAASIDRNSATPKVFLSNGMVAQDIAWGFTAYQRALELDLGQQLVMWDEPCEV